MEEFGKLLQELEDMSLSDISIHEKKLRYTEQVLANMTTYRSAPTELLANYIELTQLIEGHREKNPNVDLQIYDKVLMSMRNSVMWMEQTANLHAKNEYFETMVDTQSKIICNLKEDLQQYYGIEAAVRNGTLIEKVKSVLKKIKS